MFGSEKNDAFHDRIRYLVRLKIDFPYIFSRDVTILWGISTF